jgi:hypothetical protein
MTNYARALFLGNTTEERVELLWIISDCLEFCHQRRHIAIFDFSKSQDSRLERPLSAEGELRCCCCSVATRLRSPLAQR